MNGSIIHFTTKADNRHRNIQMHIICQNGATIMRFWSADNPYCINCRVLLYFAVFYWTKKPAKSIPDFSIEYKPFNFQCAPRVCCSFLCWFIYSIDGIFHQRFIHNMSWDIEYTDEFGQWWSSLSEDEQVSLAACVQLLKERGSALGFPHSTSLMGSKHGHKQHER